MIFKYFKGQIYLIIYLILRKLKSKTPCCLHYFGDGILGCYKPRLRLGRGKLDNYSGRLRQAQTTRRRSQASRNEQSYPATRRLQRLIVTARLQRVLTDNDVPRDVPATKHCTSFPLPSCAPPLVTIKGRGGQ
jgi:hypothetical protein